MSEYAIMRFAKYKMGSVANIERHQNHRERLTHRQHPERERLNRTYKQFPGETLTQSARRMVREQEQRTGRRVRRDAVILTEFVFTFSPSAEERIDKAMWRKVNRDWIERNFGQEAILRIDDNHDEATFHQHFFLILKDEKGNINASRFFGKKSQVVALQDTYAEAMCPFGLERGESKEKTRARHKTLQEWRKEEKVKLETEYEDVTAKENLSMNMADFILSSGQAEDFLSYQKSKNQKEINER